MLRPGLDAILAEKLAVISRYMEKRSNPSRIQGCTNYPPIQTGTEPLSVTIIGTIIFIVNYSEDPCKSPNEPIELTLWTVSGSTRKPMSIQEGQRNNWHDPHNKTASREMPGTEYGPLHDRCRPYQSNWHSQSRRALENYDKVWLSGLCGSSMVVCLHEL